MSQQSNTDCTPTRFPDRISVKEGALTLSHVDAEFGPESEPTVIALFSVPKAHYAVMCEMADRFNSHEQIVTALRELLAWSAPDHNQGHEPTPLCKWCKAESALALAKGE